MDSEKDLFLKSFEEKLRTQLDKKTLNKLSKGENLEFKDTSIDYEQFRLETLPKGMGIYERTCNFCEKIFPMKPDKKTEEKVGAYLFRAHLNCSVTGVQSTSIFFALMIVILGLMIAVAQISTTIGFGIIMIGLGLYFALQQIPAMLARRMKSKANDPSNHCRLLHSSIHAF